MSARGPNFARFAFTSALLPWTTNSIARWVRTPRASRSESGALHDVVFAVLCRAFVEAKKVSLAVLVDPERNQMRGDVVPVEHDRAESELPDVANHHLAEPLSRGCDSGSPSAPTLAQATHGSPSLMGWTSERPTGGITLARGMRRPGDFAIRNQARSSTLAGSTPDTNYVVATGRTTNIGDMNPVFRQRTHELASTKNRPGRTQQVHAYCLCSVPPDWRGLVVQIS